MNLEKAIEILHDWGILSAYEIDPDLKNAVKLGIEALKAFRDGRLKPGGMFFHDLPGETPPDTKPTIGVDASDTEGP